MPKIQTDKLKKQYMARLEKSIRHYIKYTIGKRECEVNRFEIYTAVAYAVREIAMDKMFDTASRYEKSKTKKVYYLSFEFLLGRSLENNLHNLGIFDALKDLKLDFVYDWEEIFNTEYDPALGNGGLGRLAACFLDSMASMNIPGFGYGINYKFGLFKQIFDDGNQVEKADSWAAENSPWQIERADRKVNIPLYGRVEEIHHPDGTKSNTWVDTQKLIGVPYDFPIVGYGDKTVNYLRLFSARCDDELDIKEFNQGGYLKAVDNKIRTETISKVLYPADDMEEGKALRLTQQYFFVACAIKDIIRRFLEDEDDLNKIPEKVCIQLNDTHPAIAIPEMMRVLVDEYGYDWDIAWGITTKIFAYTNHTLLPEALEKWPVSIIGKVLPRHLQIIYLINEKFLEEVRAKYGDNNELISKMSIVEGFGDGQMIRMANLSIIGSFSVNGVAALHSELVKSNLVPHFYEYWPEKFNNKTNGITPRRWLLHSNTDLATAITKRIGNDWIKDLSKLKDLEKYATNKSFIEAALEIKDINKMRMASHIFESTGIRINPHSMFIVHAKRIHEYKRQFLTAMHIMHEYFSIVKDGKKLPFPKTYIFAGKAAPGYHMAKLTIKFINNLATVINSDSKVKGMLKVVFIPDYKVSVAEKLMPSADVSVQCSTAGFEASGTGNMKFALNGALTIGTYDGANIEIREEVGEDNFYLFGLRAEDIIRMKNENSYNPWDYYENSPNIKRIMNAINSNEFCDEKEGLLFKPLWDNIMNSGDFYFNLADFDAFVESFEEIEADYKDQKLWAKKSILNIARIGKFSSDRTIGQYAKEIWGIAPVNK